METTYQQHPGGLCVTSGCLSVGETQTLSLIRSLFIDRQILCKETVASTNDLELLDFGYLQKLPEDLLFSLITILSARDLASLEATCYIFRRPLGVLPNRRASAVEILAYRKCSAVGGVWNLSADKWAALIKRCGGQWKQTLHFIEAVERARGGRGSSGQIVSQVAAGCYETLVATGSGKLVKFGKSYPLPARQSQHHPNDDATAVALPAPFELPASLLGGARVVSAAVGQSHVVLLDERGQVYTYGKDVFGCCGLGPDAVGTDISTPCQVELPEGMQCKQVSAGVWHTVALSTDGKVYTWGAGANGRLGSGNQENQPVPGLVRGLEAAGVAVQVAAGASHTLALLATGVVYSFGCGITFQLGTEDYVPGGLRQDVDALEPQPITSLERAGLHIVAVAAGEGNSAAIDSNGQVYTWGDNYCGSLGQRHEYPVGLPSLVDSLKDVRAVQVSMKKRKTLVLTDSGQIYSSGWAAMGALGVDISPSKTSHPRVVGGPRERFVQIGAGWYHSVGITAAGRLLGFGDNEHGQLGPDRAVDKSWQSTELMKGLQV